MKNLKVCLRNLNNEKEMAIMDETKKFSEAGLFS